MVPDYGDEKDTRATAGLMPEPGHTGGLDGPPVDDVAAEGDAPARPVGNPSGELTPRRPRRAGWAVKTVGQHPVTSVPEPPERRAPASSDEGDVRAVLRIPEFRRLWIQLGLSSLGDWMGLLATTAMVTQLQHGFSGQAYALGSLLIIRLAPALIFGPLAGAVADKLDRRLTMVVTDLLRFVLFLSIPIVGTLTWLLIASFLIECVTLLWAPAKEASVPHLVPKERLAAANTLSLLTTYGSAPVAAAIFALLATLSRSLAPGHPYFRDSSVDIALYFNAVTFLLSALVIWGLKSIGKAARPEHGPEPGFFASITEGWKFVGNDRLVRGLVIGILGGFAGAGCVIALGKLYVQILGGGDAAYGVLFAAVFIGLATGMAIGPKLLGDYSRTRLFGVCVTGAGITLVFVAIIPNLVLACILVVLVGMFAGVAWVTGNTLLQAEVADELRGRTFALVQSLVRIDLLLVLAAAPALVGLIGSHSVHLWGDVNVRADGVTFVLLGGGVLAIVVGLFAYRQMDDHSGVPVLPELWNALRGRRQNRRPRHAGLFVAIEGADAAVRASQLEALRSWLTETGREVVVASDAVIAAPLEASLRQLQADPSAALHPRTEALLAAAARAEHVARVIEPALARGAVVLTDHYVDSTVAHQSAASCAGLDELTVLAQWATMSLLPDVTVLLDTETSADADAGTTATDTDTDVPGSPAPGFLNGSAAGHAPTFGEEVRAAYLRLADEESHRYLVLDCAAPAGELHARIRRVVARRLGDATLSDIGDTDGPTVTAAAAGGPELTAVAAGGTGPGRPPGTGRGDEPDRRGGVDRRSPIMDTGAPDSTRFPEGSA
ncbi:MULTISPECIES: dTMP kinase [unclassified Pseudofrankia]|uniref:dTMP kinase n=1 Tax=unclassified Pseudofrankia TaxID=2994372 RepID=UPI000ADB4B74|nr:MULTISPECIES: dTMP kinase [unclassified Pseudofrankia]MDT3441785.1 dTMP kinase [Pseudofrankia sp. BMG5.37]